MKTILTFAMSLITCLAVPHVFADETHGQHETLRRELSDIRMSLAELAKRLESLEQQLGQSDFPQRTEHNLVQSLPDSWAELLSGEVAVVSFDTAKDRDLAVAIYDDSQHLSVLQAANGRWARVVSQELPTPGTPRIVLTDLEGDGASEILVCSDKLRIYTVAPTGYSLAWSSLETFGAVPAPHVGVSDFNGDGRKDIAVLNYKDEGKSNESESLYVYTRTLSRPVDFGLTSTTTFTDQHGYHSTSAMAIGDFSGDGRNEIVVGNSNGFLWLVSFETGELSVRSEWQVPSGGAIGHGLSAGNLDDDAPAELLAGTNGGDIYVFDFDAKLQPRVVASAMAGRLAYGVAAADMDGDYLDEFVLTRGHIGYAGMTQKDVVAEVWALKGSELTRVWQQETVDLPRPLVHDLDGDGRDEIVVISLHGKAMQVMKPAIDIE